MPRGDNNRRYSGEQWSEIARMYQTPNADGTWTGVSALARQFGVRQAAVDYHLARMGIAKRSMTEAHSGGKRCRPIRNLPVGNAPQCQCGCSQLTTWNRRKNRWNRYVIGHYTQAMSQNPAWNGGTSFAPYPLNWPAIQSVIRKRDRFRCQDCGTSARQADANLHVHHIDGNVTDSSPSNLVLLCVACHTARHNRMRTIR